VSPTSESVVTAEWHGALVVEWTSLLSIQKCQQNEVVDVSPQLISVSLLADVMTKMQDADGIPIGDGEADTTIIGMRSSRRYILPPCRLRLTYITSILCA
jgi:hypothetical protein